MFLWAMGPWFKHREHLSFSCVDNLAGAWCITDSLMLSFRSAGVLFGIFTQLCMSAWKSFTLLCGSIFSLRLTGSKVLCQTNRHLVYFQHCWKMYERRFRRGYVSPPMSGELKSTGWNDQGLTRLDLSLVLLMEGVRRFLKGMQFAQGHCCGKNKKESEKCTLCDHWPHWMWTGHQIYGTDWPAITVRGVGESWCVIFKLESCLFKFCPDGRCWAGKSVTLSSFSCAFMQDFDCPPQLLPHQPLEDYCTYEHFCAGISFPWGF